MEAPGEHFGMPLPEIKMERQQIRATLLADDQSKSMTADQTIEWVACNLAESHPNVWQLAAIALLLPTSTADCERGFSCLKRVKTTHGLQLSNKVLNSIIVISLQRPELNQSDFAAAVESWHSQGSRRAQIE